ncbi:MAG: dihydroorotate dehydrogenase electron transfer subunit [Persephonella sp.]|nr:MAG: dihydroorotate dehydrogenase electron transfer subunit [Persephonella sp.]RUM62359.1 MAG: dihydroorotate dehydrogenase electron transfer subunit [Persephonella sp.]
MVIDKKYIILENRHISGRTWLLRIKAPELVNAPAGSFGMIKTTSDYQFDPLMRRAFAIADVEGDEILFFYDVYGRGTANLTTKRVGDYINLLAPLGKRFFPEDEFENYVLVGGGIGFAGLSLLMKRLRDKKKNFIALYGVRRKEQLSMLDWIKENNFKDKTLIYTEDGSFGIKGLITKDLKEIVKDNKKTALMVCGPKGMMKAVVKVAKEIGVNTYLSLESKMACGFGICIGCVVKNKKTNRYDRVCYEGPVFNAEEIEI